MLSLAHDLRLFASQRGRHSSNCEGMDCGNPGLRFVARNTVGKKGRNDFNEDGSNSNDLNDRSG